MRKLDHDRRRPSFAVNVSSTTYVFGCLTSPRCILYAGCRVNAHFSHFRHFQIVSAVFRFADTLFGRCSHIRRTRYPAGRRDAFAISLANACCETR
jgi:hypothetical protein